MKVLMKAKQLKRFADGGEVNRDAWMRYASVNADEDADVKAANESDDPIRELNRRKGWTADEDDAPKSRSMASARDSDPEPTKAQAAPAKASDPEPPKAQTAPAKKQSFSEAFASAKDGSTFEWNGKKYKKEYAKPSPSAFKRGGNELPNEQARMRRSAADERAKGESKSGMGPKITNRPAPGAPSPYAGKEAWAKYRESQARGYADGGLVKRQTVNLHGKAC